VSITASLSSAGELAIGNAIGSNIANIALILGITTLVSPLMVQDHCMKSEIFWLLVATLFAGLLILDGELSLTDGWTMIVLLALILAHLVMRQFKQTGLLEKAANEPEALLPPGRAWLSFIIGLVVLIISSKILVSGAVHTAKVLGVSELVIGLTIVAVGTSLPELAASVASAMRGHTDIALGNIIGSNLFNLLVVIAIPGIVETQALEPAILSRDYLSMTLLTVFLAAAIFVSRMRSKSAPGHAYLGRTLGTLLVSSYALYYYSLQSAL
jgi:cation:H+ antiporter